MCSLPWKVRGRGKREERRGRRRKSFHESFWVYNGSQNSNPGWTSTTGQPWKYRTGALCDETYRGCVCTLYSVVRALPYTLFISTLNLVAHNNRFNLKPFFWQKLKLLTFASSLCYVVPGDPDDEDGCDGGEDAGDDVAIGAHLVEATRHCLRSASGQERKTANSTFWPNTVRFYSPFMPWMNITVCIGFRQVK